MQKGYTYADVRPVVMSLDVIEESRGFEGFVIPVQLLHPPVMTVSEKICSEDEERPVDCALMNSGITTTDRTKITLEVPDINWIKADLKHNVISHEWNKKKEPALTYYSDPESDVCLCQLIPKEVILSGQ
jgi:hypothetical protein